jgi:hypothetical protein
VISTPILFSPPKCKGIFGSRPFKISQLGQNLMGNNYLTVNLVSGKKKLLGTLSKVKKSGKKIFFFFKSLAPAGVHSSRTLRQQLMHQLLRFIVAGKKSRHEPAFPWFLTLICFSPLTKLAI